MKTLSVAIATYNGEKRIIRQLESIVNQTVVPDEIVISDDKSTDNTLFVVQEFSKKYPDIRWLILSNDKNLGYKKNFERAILKTSGDIIFLSDQDDYWRDKKIEIMRDAFAYNEKIHLLASSYCKIDEEVFDSTKNKGDSITFGRVAIEKYYYKHLKYLKFSKYSYMTHFPGCSFAIDKKCKKWFLEKYWSGDEPHDEYLLTQSILEGSSYFIDEPLFLYIRHKNAATYGKMKTRNERIQALELKKKCLQMSLNILREKQALADRKRKQLCVEDQIDMIERRINYLNSPTAKNFFSILFRIAKYEKISYFVNDILCSKKGRD